MANKDKRQKSYRGKNEKKGSGSSNFKTETRESSKNYSSATKSPHNHVEWYAKNPQLLKDAASIPYSNATGTETDLQNLFTEWSALDGFRSPGIARLSVIPSIGRADSSQSAINVASNKIYAYVRHVNSGHTNYDAPDLMLYLLAMSNVYSFINWAQRLYGVASVWANMNRYLGRSLVEAMGVQYDSLMNNLANFRYGLNVIITKAATFAVPSNLDYFKKLVESYSGYYIEGSNIKDQIYFMNPHALSWFKFGVASDGSGKLSLDTITTHSPGLAYWDDVITFGNALLAPLIASEDMNIMSGDILKAYGDGNIYKLVTMSEDYTLLPTMDIDVLEQFKNATPIGTEVYNGLTQKEIIQNPSGTPGVEHSYLLYPLEGNLAISSGLVVDGYKAGLHTNHLLTTSRESSPEVTMEISRLQVAMTGAMSTTGPSYKFSLDCGAELPIMVDYFEDPNGAGLATFGYGYATNININSAVTQTLKYISAMSAFKYHPDLVLYIYAGGTTPSSLAIRHMFDVDNYAILHADTISKMHSAALLSMLNVDGIAQL